MRPILLMIGSVVVLSYSFFIFLAALSGVTALIGRSRRGKPGAGGLTPGLILIIVIGWAVGRVWQGFVDSHDGFSWKTLSPFASASYSTSLFLAVAAAILLPYLFIRGQKALAQTDALAPSVFIALAVAKFGCLLGGCCTGAEGCPKALAITYPYGSLLYADQWKRGLVHPPDSLLLASAEDGPELLRHFQLLRFCKDSPSADLRSHIQRHGLTMEDLVAIADENRSLPVWPLPLMYTVVCCVLGISAEIIYRRATRPGLTTVFTLVSYGMMRLTLELFAGASDRFCGVTLSQWAGLCSLALGLAMWFTFPQMRLRPGSETVATPDS